MALYNKYRPTNLSMLCGQEHIKTVLSNQVKAGTVSHAYLFTGPAGTGKTTVARVLASMVNCSTGMTVDPPQDDPFVAAIMSGHKTMDVQELDAASNRGIDDIRRIRENTHYSPSEMRKRVFIIDECHALTPHAWQAILKILEEPPATVMFILCTTNASAVIETVKTRCMCFEFRSLTGNEIAQYLRDVSTKEKIQIEEEALRLIAIGARGSVRDAISKLDQLSSAGCKITAEDASKALGAPSRRIAKRFIDSVMEPKGFSTALAASSEALGVGVQAEDFFRELANYCHDTMLYGASGYDMARCGHSQENIRDVAESQEKLRTAVGKRAMRRVLRKWVDEIQKGSLLTVFNMQAQSQVDLVFIEMWEAFHASKNAFEAQTQKGETA